MQALEQVQEKRYAKSKTAIVDGEWWVIYANNTRHRLSSVKRNKAAYKEKHSATNNFKNNPANNPKKMYVNGQYVPRAHPLHKAGRYKSFNDAAFSSFANYNQTTKGDVYIITNDAWPEWIKVGKAIDATDRLKSYQTSDPFRLYNLRYSVNLDNRHTSEIRAHKALELISDERRNEWFKVDLSAAVKCLGDLDG